MARFVSSVLIDDIRGAMGNMVFDTWKGVQVIRRKSTSRSNPHSREQIYMRARITATSKRWHHLLTQEQRDRWHEFAQRRNRKGPRPKPGGGGLHEAIPEGRGPQTGYNSFQMLNALGFNADVFNRWTFINDAPLDNPPPGAITVLSGGWSAGLCSLWLEWSPPAVVLAGTRFRVWIHCWSAGVHLQMYGSTPFTTPAIFMTGARIAQGKMSLIRLHPGIYKCQVDTIGPDGQKGPSSQIVSVTVPPGCTL